MNTINTKLSIALALSTTLAAYLLFFPVSANSNLTELNSERKQSLTSADDLVAAVSSDESTTDASALQAQEDALNEFNANIIVLEQQLAQLGETVHPDYEALKSSATVEARAEFSKQNHVFETFKRMRSETPDDLELNVRMTQATVLRTHILQLSDLGVASERLNEITDKLVNARIKDQREMASAHPEGMPEPQNRTDAVLQEMLSEDEFATLTATRKAQQQDQDETVIRYSMEPYTTLLSNEQRKRVAEVVIQHTYTLIRPVPEGDSTAQQRIDAMQLAQEQLKSEFSPGEMAQIDAYLQYRETRLR